MNYSEIRKLEIAYQERAKYLVDMRSMVKDRRCKMCVLKENIRYHSASSKQARQRAIEATNHKNYYSKRIEEREARMNEDLLEVNIELYKEAVELWRWAKKQEAKARENLRKLSEKIDHARQNPE